MTASSGDDTQRHDLLAAGHTINKAELLFTKVEDETVEAQTQKLMTSEETNASEVPSQKETITFDDFTKLDTRVATVLAAEKVKKSKKLLQLTVDTGLDQRTILSGIAEHYAPEEVVGQQVCVLINLAPRKMMGIESQGMVLMAEDTDGSLRFVQPDRSAANGSTIS